MFLLFLAILSFLGTSLFGYFIHWAFHQRWSGFFYRAHLNHHSVQYPPNDFFSDTYRQSGQYNATYYFIALFSPIILGFVGMMIVGWLSIWQGISILGTMSVVGLLNAYIHDEGIHLRKSIWHYLPGFQKLVRLHIIHHKSVQKNLGMFFFGWDKLFKTYRDK
jgi:sterol desaturase/sphingolipid hydroxylase (fatty acid hydroxylase superfamily)